MTIKKKAVNNNIRANLSLRTSTFPRYIVHIALINTGLREISISLRIHTLIFDGRQVQEIFPDERFQYQLRRFFVVEDVTLSLSLEVSVILQYYKYFFQ